MTSRERITNYVAEQQMFFIMQDVPILFEDPTSDPMSFTYMLRGSVLRHMHQMPMVMECTIAS